MRLPTELLVLGSASPRRRRLLAELGVPFRVQAPDVPELHFDSEPRLTARANALRKYAWCRERLPDAAILAADTVVAHAGVCLGKPESREQAAAWLLSFSGARQPVYTGVVLGVPGRDVRCDVVVSTVVFRTLAPDDVSRYLALVDPLDKAGGYDIDQHGDLLIAACEGSRSNVAGLPMETVAGWLLA